MNLYRSFGNLMEAWVTEEGQCSYSELLGDNGEAASSPPTNPRSESVDSGVEMASATSSSVSMDNAELDGFTPERASEPSRLSCPSPPNPFSPCLPPGGARDHSALLHQRVEAALERSHSKHLNNKPECLTAAETHGRHSRAHLRHHAESMRGQRSDRPDLRRMFNPSEPMRLTRHRWSSVTSDTLTFQRKLEDLSEEGANGLSPGLCYLEHVCQMLEEFADQQRHKRALQRGRSGLQEHQEVEVSQEEVSQEEASDSCRTDSGAADSTGQRLEDQSQERSPVERRLQRPPHRHFRQRSASDANVATLHLRMKDAGCRGQHLSTDDLLMETHKDLEKQGADVEKRDTLSRSWKSKIRSLTRNFSVLRDVKRQQMQPAEGKQGLRLSQLFRRKTKPA
eukprot:XP_011603266.1 PREDICTED: uncharacterized protein LOC105416588 isoform X2 [Takifugu rubripes]